MTDIKIITTRIGLTALVVGGLIIGKKYYNYHYNKYFTNLQKHLGKSENCFIIDRLIDADCNGLPLSIGIHGRVDSNNILSRQGIRHGAPNEPIKKLISFIKVDNGLVYDFEDNTKLTLTKNNKTGVVIYSFKAGNLNITKEMSPTLIKIYKSIGMSSNEFDTIEEIVKDS